MGEINCNSWSTHDGLAAGVGVCDKGLFGGTPSMGICRRSCKQRTPRYPVRDIIVRNWQGAGDQVLVTAVLRDLHEAYPDRFRTALDAWGMDLYQNLPYVIPREQLRADAPTYIIEGMTASDDAQHYIGCFYRQLGAHLGMHIPMTRFGGDVRLSAEERGSPPPFDDPYWLVWSGTHHGFSTKWWDPAEMQKVVDHFKGKLRFVQVGESHHFHPALQGVEDRRGTTGRLREMVKLMYHAQGVVTPISFGMHLAAAVPVAPDTPYYRPCVVIAGGRESVQFVQYPGHTVLSTIGSLRCCFGKACWRNKSHTPDGRDVDCEQVVDVAPGVVIAKDHLPGLRLAKCMTLIKARHVIEPIERYVAGVEDYLGYKRVKLDVLAAAAREVLPVCQACENFDGARYGNKQVLCKKATPCCGAEIGTVDLTGGRCALDPPRWQARDCAAWRKWNAENPNP